MAPTRWPLLLRLLLLVATATATADWAAGEVAPAAPAPWPEQFHAVLFTNLTNTSAASTGPPLRLTDLYYDWPGRRNLNLVRHQLSGDPLHDVEWDNGTTFYYDSAACRTEQFPVGVLPPGWLADVGGGAAYLGRERTGGIDCHVWVKEDFIVYYEDVATRRPVRWNFLDQTKIQQFVMSFDVGVVLDDESQWQAPAYCFPATATADEDDDDHEEKSNHVRRSTIREEGGLEAAASRLLRKFARAAAF